MEKMPKNTEGHGDGLYRRITIHPPSGEPKTYHPTHRMVSLTSREHMSFSWEVLAEDGTLPGSQIITVAVHVPTGSVMEYVIPKQECEMELLHMIERAKNGEVDDE